MQINEKVKFNCPHCNSEITFTINFLRNNPILKCPKCKNEMRITIDLKKEFKAEKKRLEQLLKETTIKFKP